MKYLHCFDSFIAITIIPLVKCHVIVFTFDHVITSEMTVNQCVYADCVSKGWNPVENAKVSLDANVIFLAITIISLSPPLSQDLKLWSC